METGLILHFKASLRKKHVRNARDESNVMEATSLIESEITNEIISIYMNLNHVCFTQCCYSAQKVNRCTHVCLKIRAKSVQNNDKIGAKIGATPPFHSRIAIV